MQRITRRPGPQAGNAAPAGHRLHEGMGAAAGHRVAVALIVATTVYVAIPVANPLRAMVGEILLRRIDESLAVDLMRAVSSPRGIAHLEDPHVLDQVAQAQGAVHGATVGGTVAYLGWAWTYRLQGLAALVILTRSHWWLPLLLGAGHAVALRWRRRHWLAITQVVFDRTDSLRQADYLRRLAIQPRAAKEAQVFSLADWLVDRYRVSVLATMQPVRMADPILVVEDGRVVERGDHDELMAAGGRYAELYGLQARSYR